VQSLSALGVEQPLRLDLLTNDGYCVSEETSLHPEQTMIHGLGRVISQEFEQIRCRAIDVALEPSRNPASVASQIFQELAAELRDDVVVLRGGDRWLQNWERVPLEASDRTASRLRQGGVYLITGGLGGIAIELAAYLASSVKAQLVLTGRSAVPDRADWDLWLRSHDAGDPTSTKLLALKRLEGLGAKAAIFQADVSDRRRMNEVFQRAKERFGRIDGVIHTAGLPGGGMIEVARCEDIVNTLKPKLQGTRVLESLAREYGADFLMLCSSLSSLLGGLGHADYCAANLFLDALAQSRRGTAGPHIVSVNWSAWKGTGMAAHYKMPEDLRAWQEEIHKNGISPAEGQQAFRRILDSGLPQVAVCTEDLPRWLREKRLLTPAGVKTKQGAKKRALHARPRLEVSYEAPQTEIETTVAAIWEQLLGVTPVGVHDNFFSLGGHSLLGTQLIARLHDAFGVKLSLRKLFEGPTVAALAAAVSEKQAELDAAEQQRLMAMIAQLDEGEIDAELRKRASAAR
jgi:NAD(P)-dependent dehydrogenase (short-subunit alcohol dehydrogenase family)/acyl carrier protein